MPLICRCLTTEILEGFDVQRTTGYPDTEKTYGHLTLSIIDYYSTHFSSRANTSRVCLSYDEFVKKCSDPKKLTVSDIFALQLMQVIGQKKTSPSPWRYCDFISWSFLLHKSHSINLLCNAGTAGDGRNCARCNRALPDSFIACSGILHACQSPFPLSVLVCCACQSN
jgi:hypothetical protein